ncbi:hypothetical protein Tco_0622365 [Tanacetum coccineum]
MTPGVPIEIINQAVNRSIRNSRKLTGTLDPLGYGNGVGGNNNECTYKGKRLLHNTIAQVMRERSSISVVEKFLESLDSHFPQIGQASISPEKNMLKRVNIKLVSS